ncbi:fasciclin-like arabinogalactan protein 9 [Asparagus officinalis]|uniref:fasciclin-like arabinogalactan protein 9 n=1 Tax=Asparagus officinalis TaxID=4686 RepID=UPI00098E63BB|nr:fasciclin-like arabinogalactan protein 9 [Asparagus officinalis]
MELVNTTLVSIVASTSVIAVGADAFPSASSGVIRSRSRLHIYIDKGSQYTTLIRLLKQTQVGEQIQSQLNNSFQGLTIFAATDNAFNNLKPGTLNGLTSQEQVALVLYHVLPRYYSMSMFETASNPVNTQASGSSGVYNVNIISASNQVNVSTGVDETQIGNDLYSDFPLAVYSVDQVLLPYDLFGPKPAPRVGPKKKAGKVPAAKAPSVEADSSTPSAATGRFEVRSWGLGFGVVLMFVGYLV